MRKIQKLNIIIFLIALINYPVYSQSASTKIGFCGPINAEDIEIASNFTWYYNWGTAPGSAVIGSISDSIEYVPMVWGASFDETALRTYLSEHPEIEFLLGFNEPNISTQSNLGPAAAAEAWPALEAIADDFNLKLVGPAPVPAWAGVVVVENGIEYIEPDDWYDAFFDACADCRVDHIAVHAYYNSTASVSGLLERMSKYNKPIWLTEFNHSSYDGNGNNNTSFASQEDFMQTIVPVLEGNPDVFRYAWFMNRCPQENTNLFGDPGELTGLGALYADIGSGELTGLLDGYTYSCGEGEIVDVSDTVTIAYGANGEFKYLHNVTEDCECSSDAFGGDPIWGYVKACYTKPNETAENPTAIGDSKHAKLDISVYPNPFTNTITVEGLSDEALINIFEPAGKLVLTDRLNNLDKHLDLSQLKGSFYILTVIQNTRVGTFKIIRGK